MDVILLNDVDKVGLKGDVVNVARGYARNYLLPRRLAEVATPGAVAELRERDEQRARRLRPQRGLRVRQVERAEQPLPRRREQQDADGAEEDGVAGPDLLQHGVGQHLAGAQVAVRS